MRPARSLSVPAALASDAQGQDESGVGLRLALKPERSARPSRADRRAAGLGLESGHHVGVFASPLAGQRLLATAT